MAIWLVCVSYVSQRRLRECMVHTAMLPGGTSQESTQLNIESLWSGGPFQDPVRVQTFRLEAIKLMIVCASQLYNGGNSPLSQHTQLAQDMQSIRQNIFSSPSGTIDSAINLSIYVYN